VINSAHAIAEAKAAAEREGVIAIRTRARAIDEGLEIGARWHIRLHGRDRFGGTDRSSAAHLRHKAGGFC